MDKRSVIKGLKDTANYFRRLQAIGFFGDQPAYREHEAHCNNAIVLLTENEIPAFVECPRCGRAMRWVDDFSFEDLGREGDGITSFYDCPNCGAEVELSVPNEKEEENDSHNDR